MLAPRTPTAHFPWGRACTSAPTTKTLASKVHMVLTRCWDVWKDSSGHEGQGGLQMEDSVVRWGPTVLSSTRGESFGREVTEAKGRSYSP